MPREAQETEVLTVTRGANLGGPAAGLAFGVVGSHERSVPTATTKRGDAVNLTRRVSVGALLLGLVLAPFFSASAQDACVGSWVYDPAASAVPPGGAAPTAGTLEIKNVGGGQFTAITETTAGGMVVRNEITYALDGKYYPFTYTPAPPPGTPPNTQSIEQVDATLYKISIKIGGQEMLTGTTEVSGDGKTLTQKATGVGQIAGLSSTSVYRRE